MNKFMRGIQISVLLFAGAICASAEGEIDNTFCFVDDDGNVVPDGGSITVQTSEHERFSGDPAPSLQAEFGLSLKNVSSGDAAVELRFETINMPNGSLTVCFPRGCESNVPKDYTTSVGELASGEKKSLESEWFPERGGYGTATFTIQVNVMDILGPLNYDFKAYGPKITVNCVYADPAGIEDVHAVDNDDAVNVYDMAGRPVVTNASKADFSSLGKGLYICETMKNGKRIVQKKIKR